MNLRTSSLSCMLGVLVACVVGGSARAKELDQFTDRRLLLSYYAGGFRSIAGAPGPVAVDAVLDARMNLLLERLQRSLASDPPRTAAARDALVRQAFEHRVIPELVTPYEEWVKHEAPVPLYKVRDKGIFGQAVDYDDMRMTWYIELSPILQVSGVLMGIDKLGHFLAQGFTYYEQYRELQADAVPSAARLAAIRALGHRQELGQLGVATGGVYSYADLAANWAGMEFFLALFDAVDMQDRQHAPYFERTSDGAYRRVRAFHWAEWVSPDWDEVLNPASVAERVLFEKVAANLQIRPGSTAAAEKSICEWYRQDPAAFSGTHTPLRERSAYAQPQAGARVAPYALDVRSLCAPDGRLRNFGQASRANAR